MLSWPETITFILFSAGRPDTWLWIAGAAITIFGMSFEQWGTRAFRASVEQLHEKRLAAIRDLDRLESIIREASEGFRWDTFSMGLAISLEKPEMLKAFVHAGLIMTRDALVGMALVLKPPQEVTEIYTPRIAAAVEKARKGDLDENRFLSAEYEQLNKALADLIYKRKLELFDLEEQITAGEKKVRGRERFSTIVAILGFTIVLFAGLVGSQLDKFRDLASTPPPAAAKKIP